MKRGALFTASEKGGVGKSTFARGLLDHIRRFKAEDQTVLAIDCQPSVGHLARFYGLKGDDGTYSQQRNASDMFNGVRCVSTVGRNIEHLAHSMETNPDFMLVDMAGGALADIPRIYGTVPDFVEEVKALGYSVMVAICIDPLLATAASIHKIMDAWGDNVEYVAVVNRGRSESGVSLKQGFPFFYGSLSEKAGNPRERILDSGGLEFVMPGLDQVTYALVDAAEVSFTEFINRCNESPGERLYGNRTCRFRDMFDVETKLKLGIFSDAEYGPENILTFEALERRHSIGREL